MFDSYTDVVASEFIRKGWIPDFLPPSATQVRVSWNTGHNVFRFVASVDERDFLQSVGVAGDLQSIVLLDGAGADPFELVGAGTPVFARCSDKKVTFASFRDGWCYYWNSQHNGSGGNLCATIKERLGGRK